MPPKSVNPLHFLTETRVAIVAGKGGVGKTTVTAVLARAAADAGLRPLVVELDGKPTLQALLGPDIEVLELSATTALAEYLNSHGLGRVSRRLASTGVIDVVATAAPGIDDIVLLGKIKQLERSGWYDLIVVDGPAAGHALTMLQAAASLQATVRSGPVRTQANDVAAMLSDPQRCQVVMVTLPETTPVNEVIETSFALEDRVGVSLACVVVNAVDDGAQLPTKGKDTWPTLRAAAKFRNGRRKLHAVERERLHNELALPQVVLPFIASATIGVDEIARLVEAVIDEGLAT